MTVGLPRHKSISFVSVFYKSAFFTPDQPSTCPQCCQLTDVEINPTSHWELM